MPDLLAPDIRTGNVGRLGWGKWSYCWVNISDMYSARLAAVSVKRQGRLALDSVDAEIPAGRVVALLGPSGAGKSTFMRTLLGVQANVTGRVEVLGRPAGARELDTRVAYSTQLSSVFDDLNVRSNLVYACRMVGVNKTRVDELMDLVGLLPYAKVVAGRLSVGQRSRVSLAMALVGDPEFLVLDEPTVGLDPVLRAELWTMFRQFAGEGKTLLISSHAMDEAERCDHIIFIRDGRVLANATYEDLLHQTGASSAENAFLALADAVR